jgi:hypothetical protein
MEPKEGYIVYGKYQGNEYKVWFDDLDKAREYANIEEGVIAIYQIEKIID